MTRKEKELLKALNEINRSIYAIGAPLGSAEYFKIMELCINAIKKADGKVE